MRTDGPTFLSSSFLRLGVTHVCRFLDPFPPPTTSHPRLAIPLASASSQPSKFTSEMRKERRASSSSSSLPARGEPRSPAPPAGIEDPLFPTLCFDVDRGFASVLGSSTRTSFRFDPSLPVEELPFLPLRSSSAHVGAAGFLFPGESGPLPSSYPFFTHPSPSGESRSPFVSCAESSLGLGSLRLRLQLQLHVRASVECDGAVWTCCDTWTRTTSKAGAIGGRRRWKTKAREGKRTTTQKWCETIHWWKTWEQGACRRG